MSMPIPGRRLATGWRPHAPLALRSGQSADADRADRACGPARLAGGRHAL